MLEQYCKDKYVDNTIIADGIPKITLDTLIKFAYPGYYCKSPGLYGQISSTHVIVVYEYKKGTRKRLGYYPHAVSYLSSDLQIVKDHFIADVQKSAEGRLKWLQDQVSKTESTAQGMIDKVNKL